VTGYHFDKQGSTLVDVRIDSRAKAFLSPVTFGAIFLKIQSEYVANSFTSWNRDLSVKLTFTQLAKKSGTFQWICNFGVDNKCRPVYQFPLLCLELDMRES
jgi:hypothetical protein